MLLYLLQGLLVDPQRKSGFFLFQRSKPPISVAMTHCFSLPFRAFVGHTTQFGLSEPRRDPLVVLKKRPHCGRLWLRGGRYDPRAFSCFVFSHKSTSPTSIHPRNRGRKTAPQSSEAPAGPSPPASPQKRTQRLTGGNSAGKRDEPHWYSRGDALCQIGAA